MESKITVGVNTSTLFQQATKLLCTKTGMFFSSGRCVKPLDGNTVLPDHSGLYIHGKRGITYAIMVVCQQSL